MELDPYSETFFEDPWDTYRWLRDEHPIYHHERLGFYAVSRYDDCLEVHKDAASFSSTRGVTLDQLPGITFGHGIHFCIGSQLARPEGRTAFRELYRRWPDLQVDLDGIRYVHMTNVAGPSSVPVTAG